jgi:hypothetical protein
MVSAVRTSLLSVQASVHAEKNRVLRNMTRELKTLKENYPGNFMQIKELELDLANYNENSLREELEEYKIFNKLNNEKLTPFFMKLVRIQNTVPDLSKIKGENGEDLSEIKLEKHVTKFYRNLYEKPRNSIEVNQEHILEFLGPVQHAKPVINSKLNEAENTELERPLHISEFDRAIKQCNIKAHRVPMV